MNDVQYRILELLAVARTNGLFQTDLATKLNVDAKTVFFHLKKLEVLAMM
jgi:predicted transcriptional regulator